MAQILFTFARKLAGSPLQSPQPSPLFFLEAASVTPLLCFHRLSASSGPALTAQPSCSEAPEPAPAPQGLCICYLNRTATLTRPFWPSWKPRPLGYPQWDVSSFPCTFFSQGLHSSQPGRTVIWVFMNMDSLRTHSEAQGQALEGEFPVRKGSWALSLSGCLSLILPFHNLGILFETLSPLST